MRKRASYLALVGFILPSILLLVVVALSACGAPPAPTGAEMPTSAPAAAEATLAPAVPLPLESTMALPVPTSVGSPQAPAATQLPAIQEARHLTIEWPPTIRVGDSDVIRLTLEVDAQGNLTPTAQMAGHETHGETVFIPNLYDTHNVLAEARLDMSGVQVTPDGDTSEPLLPGESVTFFWSVRPEEVGTFRGMIWVHLRFIPHSGGPESRKPLTAQLVEVQAVDFLGLGGIAARLVGGLGTLVGSVLGLDNVIPWVVKRLRKKN